MKKPFAHVAGYVLAIIGGIFAIGITVWFTHTATPLYACILLTWGLATVRNTETEEHGAWMPALVGFVLLLAYVGVGIVAFYTKEPNVLWAMILADFLAEAIN